MRQVLREKKESKIDGNKCLRALQSYYRFEFVAAIKLIQRPTWMGIILIFIQLLFRLEIMISSNLSQKLNQKDNNIELFFSWHFFFQREYSSNIFYLLFTTNCLLLMSFILHFIGITYKLQKIMTLLLKKIIGIICSCYLYLLFIPNVFFSLDQMNNQNITGSFNFFLTLIIGLLLMVHDQSFLYFSQDSLCSRQNYRIGLLILALEAIASIFLVHMSNPKIMLLPSLILSIYCTIETQRRVCFEKKLMRIVYRVFCFFYLEMVIILYFGLLITYQSQSLVFMSMSFAPLAASTSILIENFHCNIFKWPIDSVELFNTPEDLDFFLRLLIKEIKIDFPQYIERVGSIIFEFITLKHKQTCEDLPDCFCDGEPNEIVDFLKMRIEKDHRHKFLIKYIRMTYQKFIKESFKKYRRVETSMCFSYLSYLMEIYQSDVLSLSEMIRLKNIANFSIREDALLHHLYQEARYYFRKQEQSLKAEFLKRKQEKKQKHNTVLEDNSFETSTEINLSNFFVGIYFDEQVSIAETSYFNILQQKADLLTLLAKDHINLKELWKQGELVMKLRDEINVKFIELFKINPTNSKLQFYMEGFSTYFGFGLKKRLIFSKGQTHTSEIIKTDINVFSKNSCVIFITLVNQIGNIVRAQNNIENIFGHSKQKIINQSMSMILPTCMRKKHEEVLIEYLRNPETSKRNKFSLFLGQNEKGFAVPISMKFRPDNFLLEDCGLTGLIQKPFKEYNYIQITAESFQIQCISQGVYEKCFQSFFSLSEIYKIQFNRILPILNSVQERQELTQSIKTIGFLPKIESFQKGIKKYQYLDRLNKEEVTNYIGKLTIEFYDVYQVKFKFIRNNFKKFSFNILEIHSFKKIDNFQIQKDALTSFKIQLDQMLNYKLDIKNDMEILDQLIELQSLEFLQSLHYGSDGTMQSYHQGQISNGFNFIKEEEEEDQIILQSEKFNEQDYQFIQNEEVILPLNAQRDLSYKDDTLNNGEISKLGQSQSRLLKGNNSIMDSQLNQGSRIGHVNKYHEISEFGDGQQQYEDNDISKNYNSEFLQIQNNNEIQPSLASPSQQGLILSHQSILSPNVNTTSLVSPHSSLISPHYSMISPHYSMISPHSQEQTCLQRNPQQNERRTKFFRSNKADHIIDVNNFNNSIEKQQSSSFPFKKGSTFTTSIESKPDIIGNFTKEIPKQNLDTQKQLEPVKSIERLLSVQSILNEYYDHKFLDQNVKSGRKKTIGIIAAMSSPTSKERIKTKINLKQVLKERIKQAKTQMDLTNQNLNSINSMQQLENIQSIQSAKIYYHDTLASPKSQGKISAIQQMTEGNQNQVLNKKKSQKKENKIKQNQALKKNNQNKYIDEENSSSEVLSDSFNKNDEIQIEMQGQERQRSKILGTTSVHTSQSNNQEQKKLIQRLVNSKKRNISLMVLLVFGILTLGAFLALVIYQYFENILIFQIAHLNFKYLPWALSQRYNFSTIFANFFLKEIIKSGQIDSYHNLSAELQESQNHFQQVVQNYRNNTQDFFYSNLQDTSFFKYTQISKLTNIQSKDITILPNPLLNDTSYKIYQNVTLQYFMLRLQYLFWKVMDYPDLQSQIMLQDNVIPFLNIVSEIKESLVSSVKNVTQGLSSSSEIIMILVIIAVSVLAFVTFPLYFHVTSKNESALKLFATISSQSLFEMLQPIMMAVTQHKTGKVKLSQFDNIKKRKAISSTTTLPKFQPIHVLYIVIGIILMVIQPVVSFIYIKQFQIEASLLTDLTIAFYNARPLAASTRFVHFSMILYKLGNYEIYNPLFYTLRIEALSKDIDYFMSSIYNSMKECQASSRFEDSLYQNFFYKLVSENVCEAIKQNQEYIPRGMKFDTENCFLVRGGLMQKGIEIAIKDYISSFEALINYYSIADRALFVDQLNSALNLEDFDQYYWIISQTIEIMKEFLGNRIASFIQTMNNIFYWLLIYQLIMMILVFYFGYMRFYLSVEKSMFGVKRILNVLSIEAVLENPYIVSFLTREE